MIFIFLIILSLPLYLARFSVFEIKTNVLDILLILLAAYSLFTFHFSLFTNTRVKKLLSPIALIIIGAAISTINSSNILQSLGILKSYFILPILFLFAISSIIKTQEQKEKVLKAWFLGGFIVALISLFYWLVGELTYDGRLRAFFESPNQLAMFLAPAFIVGTYNLQLTTYNLKSKNIYFLQLTAIGLIGISLLLTKSLGAIIALMIAFLLFFYIQVKKCKKINILIPGIILLLVVSCLLLVAKKDFSERSSLSSRVMIWQSAGAILKDNWLWGIGPGTFQKKYLEYQKYFPPYLEWASPQPHSIFLAFWLQTGIIGFVGFLWLIFIFFKNVRQNKKDDIIFLSGILMIYTLMHGLIDATYWKNDLAIIFWAIILLSLSLEPVKSSTQQD